MLGGTVMRDEALALFKKQRCPAGWKVQMDGASSVNMGRIGKMKSAGATVMATTRVESPSDQSLRLDLSYRAARGTKRGTINVNHMVLLNGQVIHEDVELKGATPGGVSGKEAQTGPLMFQGNHGEVAFRNIKITPQTTRALARPARSLRSSWA